MTQFQKYSGKPVVIEAVQLTKDNAPEIKKLIGIGNYIEKAHDPVNLHVKTREGVLVATPGSWIIKGTIGEFYPCLDEVFKAKYEKVGV